MAVLGVKELAEIFLGSQLRRGLMVLIRAAFDASMDEPCGITAVAGYIGSLDDWAEVESKWNAHLAFLGMEKYRLAKVFHQYGQESGLERSLGFAHILSQSKLRSISAHMLDTDWTLLDKDSEYRKLYPKRQHACLDMLLDVLAEDINLHYKDNPIAVAFDNDYGNIDTAARVYEAWRDRARHPGFGSISFIKGTADWDVVPLQCADLLAGAIRRDPVSKDILDKPFSGQRPYDAKLSIATVRTWAMANGRGTQWSVAIAREVERLRKQWRDSEGERSS